MKEFLVAVACLYNEGCTEAASNYYATQPELQILAEKIERDVEQAIGPLVAEYAFPAAAIATKREAVFRLTNNINAKINKEHVICEFSYSF